jgi:lipopolysaccharide/colanic/teichoic acid biosynthesis glycosyltransferase
MRHWYRRYGKRALDAAGAGAALVVLAPVIAAVAGVTRVAIGSPVLFRQRRPGLGGRPFEMLKFRTMTDARGPDGKLLSDAERLTRFGKWLRSTSLDELPELWNVLRGDMSLVGPRPLLMGYLELYSARQARRHEVRPGLTGLAQVRGRNAIDWPERLEHDVEYVDRLSLSLDLRIILDTVRVIFGRHGVSAEGEATMPLFRGQTG